MRIPPVRHLLLGLGCLCLLAQVTAAAASMVTHTRGTAPPSDRAPFVTPAADATAPQRADASQLGRDLQHFPELAARAAWVRVETLAFHARLAATGDRELTGADIEHLRRGSLEHLAVRDELMAIALRYEGWLDDDLVPGLSEEQRAQGVTLALASAVTLYDNFEAALLPIQRNKGLRRILNQADPAFGLPRNQLLRAYLEYAHPRTRRRVRSADRWLRDRADCSPAECAPGLRLRAPAAVLDTSPALISIRRGNVVGDHLVWATLWLPRGRDDFFQARRESVHALLAGLFPDPDGGAPPVGRGRLTVTPALLDDLRGRLRPLDLLLDKSRYRVVDRFIPGYFTHLAIWTGSPAELRALGLWEHPIIRPHQAAILDGARIIEAVRAGVVTRSLEDFLHLDDVAILRPARLADPDRAATLLRAFAQIGKEYDFNFDVRTTDRIMCSELVYLVYADVAWPSSTILGRRIVLPDHVARMAVAETAPLEVVLFYHNGERFEKGASSHLRQVLEF